MYHQDTFSTARATINVFLSRKVPTSFLLRRTPSQSVICFIWCVFYTLLELHLHSRHLASMDWEKTTTRRGEKHLSFGIWFGLYKRFNGMWIRYCIDLLMTNLTASQWSRRSNLNNYQLAALYHNLKCRVCVAIRSLVHSCHYEGRLQTGMPRKKWQHACSGLMI